MVEGGGFEPPKAEPSDLQSDPFGHSGTPPRGRSCVFSSSNTLLSTMITLKILEESVTCMDFFGRIRQKNPEVNHFGVYINWCRHQESNSGPTDYKSVALPTELCRQ